MKRNIKMKNRLKTPLRAAFFAGTLAAISMQASAADDIYSEIDHGTQIPPSQTQIIEDGVGGVWKVLKKSLPFTFNAGKAPGLLTSVAGILEALLVPLTNLLIEISIVNGDHLEFLTYLPPNFNNNAFSISVYDVYNTTGKFTGELKSETDDVLFQVKVYPEFSANQPTTYKLKNLENLHFPVSGTIQNMVLEFYNADGSQLIESLVLPAKTNNKDFGITLAKTKNGSNIYYLKKETRHHITNLYTIEKLLDPLFEYLASDRDTVEKRLAGMDPWRAASFEHFVWMNAKASNKSELSSHPEYYNGNVYDANYILSLWQDPSWQIRGNSVYNYGEVYYSDFISNASVTEDRGLMLGEGGQANYQLYIPKAGTYGFSFHFTNSEEQQVTVFNPMTEELVYSVTLPASGDGQPQASDTRQVELELEKGLLFLELNADNVEVDGIYYKFLRNDAENSQAYLEARHDFIRREVINAGFYMDEGNATPLHEESIEYGLAQANWLLDESIIPGINDLTVLGYDLADPLMLDISDRVMALEKSIKRTRTNLQFVRTGTVSIEAEDYAESYNTEDKGDFLRFGLDGAMPVAGYDVHIPKAGNYQFYYRVAKDNQLDGDGFSIRVNFQYQDDVAIAPSQGEFSLQAGFTIYLDEGEAGFQLYGYAAEFDLDNIELHYLD